MPKHLINKKDVEIFYQLAKEGWEPTFQEIKDKFFPYGNFDKIERQKYARLLVMNARRKLKKEGLYFYSVNDHFKLLVSSQERLGVTNKLWNLTEGFKKSTNSLLIDTAKLYPRLSRRFLMEMQANFRVINQLATQVTFLLTEAIKSADEQEEKNEKKQI